MEIPHAPLMELHRRLGFANPPSEYPKSSLQKPLTQWRMETDDAPIFRYLYRNFRPRRHLEFGTWSGLGTLCCLEECDATVWTINLPFGEGAENEPRRYGHTAPETDSVRAWAKRVGLPVEEIGRTDSLGFIGRFYLEKNLGNRVCQIYSDSLRWDCSQYPPGFFDSILVDGGHTVEIVRSDTRKALSLLRPGGLIMWHDFCPDQQVANQCPATVDVRRALEQESDLLAGQLKDLFWIKPSWILAGVKAG